MLALAALPALSLVLVAAPPEGPPIPPDPAREKLGAVLSNLGEPKKNFVGMEAADLTRRRSLDANYSALRQEQVRGRWFAALVSMRPDDEFAILDRFSTQDQMADYLLKREAVVEVWSYQSGGKPSRRLTARELSERSWQVNPRPTFLTATFQDPDTGLVEQGRLEFGLHAAAQTAREGQSYRRHRLRKEEIRRILRARTSAGLLSATAQWRALRAAAQSGRIPLATLPAQPEDDHDFFVAFECEVDARGQITRVVRAYRASQISHRVVGGSSGLYLKSADGRGGRTALAVRVGEGEGVPIPGRDVLEVRIQDENQPDRSSWNLLEFGEPWVLRESGLAQLGLISAHLENRRKEMAWQKSNLDRFAEPVFAGLNVGGGLAGAGTPLGEAARLAYNLLVTPSLTPDVPSPKELEDLFRFLAAKSRDPSLSMKPGKLLTRGDVEQLTRAGAELSEREVEDAIRAIDDDDLKAMLAFPSWQNLDQKYRLVVDVLTDLGKVTGASESGILKDIFNNSKLAPNGEFSITTTLAVALGNETITPLSGVSLEQLADGDGPSRAWLQYLNLTVDLRALANTVSLLRRKGQKDRELTRPFPHAPRLSDLAAYELRLFGYPTLFWYKRGLLKNDIEAYRNDFAYGISGTEVIERFPTQVEFQREVRAGRMAPIGFARIPDGLRRAGRESNLPVYGHRIRSGKHAGKTAIIVYGLKAFRSHSAFMERELKRFHQFERVLSEGGVIRKLVDAEHAGKLPLAEFEPQIWVGSEAVSGRFNPLLDDLLELQRLSRFRRWKIELDASERAEFDRLAASLQKRGVAAGPGAPDPLEKVDPYFSSFVYRTNGEGGWRRIQMIHIPSTRDLARGAVIAEEKLRREALRRRAAGRVQINP